VKNSRSKEQEGEGDTKDIYARAKKLLRLKLIEPPNAPPKSVDHLSKDIKE